MRCRQKAATASENPAAKNLLCGNISFKIHSVLFQKKVGEIMSDSLSVTRIRNECQKSQALSFAVTEFVLPNIYLTLILSRKAEAISGCLVCGCNRPVRQYAPSSNPSASPEPLLPFPFLKSWVSSVREAEDSCRLLCIIRHSEPF